MFNKVLHIPARIPHDDTILKTFLPKLKGVKIYSNIMMLDDAHAEN